MQKPTLNRTIGLVALTVYGVGDILGAGIYGLVGKAAGTMGSAVWLAFFVSMVAAGLTGLSYASLGSRYPKAAGAAYITNRAYRNRFLSYMVGLAVLASGLTSMATASRVFAGYLTSFFSGANVTALAIMFSIIVAAIVYRGIRESIMANGLLTFIEVAGLLFVIFVGASYIGNTNYLDATTPANPTGEITFQLFMTGAVLTFYSFIGFEDILNVSEEVKNPSHTIPRALILAVVISSAIYMTISLIAVSVVPAAELANSQKPLADVVARAAPWFPPWAFSFIALFAVANTALLNFVMGSRLLYGMSEQKLLPQFLSHLHVKRRTPHKAVLVIWLILCVLILSGDISTLARSTSVLLLSCFTLINIALVILKRREQIAGTFEVPTWVPVLGAAICLVMLSQAQKPEIYTAGGLLTLIALLYGFKVLRAEPA